MKCSDKKRLGLYTYCLQLEDNGDTVLCITCFRPQYEKISPQNDEYALFIVGEQKRCKIALEDGHS